MDLKLYYNYTLFVEAGVLCLYTSGNFCYETHSICKKPSHDKEEHSNGKLENIKDIKQKKGKKNCGVHVKVFG